MQMPQITGYIEDSGSNSKMSLIFSKAQWIFNAANKLRLDICHDGGVWVSSSMWEDKKKFTNIRLEHACCLPLNGLRNKNIIVAFLEAAKCFSSS